MQMNAVSLLPSSLVDPVGSMFEHDGRLYRGIRNGFAGFYRSLFETNTASKLIELGFAPTCIADIEVESFELVLNHERIPFVTYPAEWPSALLKKVAIFICELELGLLELGFHLKDGHPWNVLFDGLQPVFVDWGSLDIIEGEPTAGFLNEVLDWILFPLFLKSSGFHNLARAFLLDVSRPPRSTPEGIYLASRPLSGRWFQRVITPASNNLSFANWVSPILKRATLKEQLREAIRIVRALPLGAGDTEWATYAGAEATQRHDEPSTWNVKTENVVKRLNNANPQTVIDIGCNRGWYSEFALRIGAKVLAVDVDEASLNTLCTSKESDRGLTAAIFDLAAPTQPHGVAGSYASALNRYSADFVLALAVTHHLVFKRHMSFGAIADSLASMTNPAGTVVVEFVPSNDIHVTPWITNSHSFYTVENFMAELRKRFANVSAEEAYPEPRILCICQNPKA